MLPPPPHTHTHNGVKHHVASPPPPNVTTVGKIVWRQYMQHAPY